MCIRDRCTLTLKNLGKIAPGLHLRMPICVWFFVTNTMRTFGHFSCNDFGCCWNKRRESVSACIHWWKIAEFLCREFYRSQKQLEGQVLSRGCLTTAWTSCFVVDMSSISHWLSCGKTTSVTLSSSTSWSSLCFFTLHYSMPVALTQHTRWNNESFCQPYLNYMV